MAAVQIAEHAIPLEPGTLAPDFELQSTPSQTVGLSELRGRPVVLVFYPEDWSPVCSDQLALYQELLPEFRKHEAELAGSRLTASGATSPSPRTATCGSRCSPTSSRRARSLACTRSIARLTERANARSTCSTPTARALELDLERFDDELARHLHADRVREDFMSGVRSGVNGTPTFLINGARHDASFDYETLLEAIERSARPAR